MVLQIYMNKKADCFNPEKSAKLQNYEILSLGCNALTTNLIKVMIQRSASLQNDVFSLSLFGTYSIKKNENKLQIHSSSFLTWNEERKTHTHTNIVSLLLVISPKQDLVIYCAFIQTKSSGFLNLFVKRNDESS